MRNAIPLNSAWKEIGIFPTLFDHAAVSMAVVLTDGSMLTVNRAFCEFVGYSEAELLQLKVFDITLPEDLALTAAQFRKGSEKNPSSFQYEKRYLRKDRGIVWGLVSGSWVIDASGITYGVALIQDITTRKQSEIALRESEGRFRGIFENAAAGIYTIAPQGRFLQVNRAMCQFVGYAEEKLLEMTVKEITHPDDLDLTRRSIEKSLSGPPFSWHYQKRYRHKDGSTLWGQVCGVWQLDEKGLPVYGIGLIQDISERKRSEEALHASEARYRRLFEANPNPMWIYDPETLEFLAVNDAAVAHYGFSRDEILKMTVAEIRPERVPAMLAGLTGLTETQEVSGQGWTCHRRKDGSLIDVEIHSHDIDFDGRSARIVLAHDVTESRRAEERMRLDAAALMSTRDAVMIIDRTPRILSVNPAFTEITGYAQAEILGEHPRMLGSSRHDRAFFRKIGTSLLQKSHWQGEVWGRRQSGETFPGWLTVSTVNNRLGKPTHFVGVMTDLTKLRASEERLRYLASYDALTDLPNRRMLESVLQHALERARRERQQLALLVMDIDQFKTINESFGHNIGDELLVAVVQRLRGRVRSADTLSRLAGDQFGLVMERLQDDADAEILARDLHSILEAPFELQSQSGQQIYLRTSIGISLYPQDGTSAHDLLRGADAAVNLAKERGGNQYCYCTAELNIQARQRLELQTELRQALEREEFLLHYQPKVDLRSGRIVGAEALLRWNSPEKGMIPPLQFIPQAEKNGLIVPIGAWVIEEACRQIREWRETGLENVCVAVNVSARQFRSGNLEGLVSEALQRHGVDPRCLTLELTESMVMNDPEEAINRIAGLRRIGVQLSLDDFGTGYSSLGYLGRFRIDQLKIDRSFITDIVTDPNAATIATSVIALAHRMRLKVVAEGVETEAQLGYLRQNGCDEMQGFYFSRPVRAEDFAGLLRQGKALTWRKKDRKRPCS